MDPIPPPPYSETDIYSNTSSHPNLTPATSQADNLSVASHRQLSIASSIDDSVIYTPLHSPTASDQESLQDGFGHGSTSSAAVYFESRPVHGQSPAHAMTYNLTITPRTRPEELPYPQGWAIRDVTEQDWQTFVNYLLPDHIAAVNNDVADRKFQQELVEERMHQLSLGPGDDRSRADISEVDAQLDPLRIPLSPRSTESHSATFAMIAEWNDGFFKPRGIEIAINEPKTQVAADEETRQMPGAWVPYDHETPGGASRNRSGGRRGLFGSLRSFSGLEANSGNFRMGPIVADNEGLRIGKNGLVASANGFRMGNMFVADQSGLRLGGARGFVADGHGVSIGGRAFGRRDSNDHRHEHHKRGRGRGRRHGYHHRHRGRSASTSSSSSSDSDASDVESSVGSLPDYDDIQEQALPVARRSLIDWLNHPDQPITKDTVKDMKREIKTARTESPEQFQQDLVALRKEVRDLMKTFKEQKRVQKQQRRVNRRARRAAKKTQRKARRDTKKEDRKARKDERKCKDKGEFRHGPPWARSRDHLPMSTPAVPMPILTPETPPSARGFPFGRAPSVPFIKPPFSRPQAPPGISAMHGGWPYTQGLSVPPILGRYPSPSPVSQGAEHLHEQAVQMDSAAERKEAQAIAIRTAATALGLGEKQKLKMMTEASTLEEGGEKYRREADRLRAEASHLDGELARELHEENEEGQVSGVIQH
ncbi:hypothetical protein LHYA1_G006369 [Lachnellula hyalina]|uniref:Uncharacterized protein n=1 Tax=Lachnellula hyalina TaxID=1316788 RepID=A0A8H8QWY3_9HELO|nr:uncharacterized protein LHYA1_G006369 [Lachnellula hyalina]TVY24343.1 hypothetical protein LHYA1_G006369 [Lachnellula hyalina]